MNMCVFVIIELLLVVLVRSENSGEWTILTVNAEPYFLNIDGSSPNKQFGNSSSQPIGSCDLISCKFKNKFQHEAAPEVSDLIQKNVIQPIILKNNISKISIHKIDKFCSSYHELLTFSKSNTGYYFLRRRNLLYIWDPQLNILQSCYKGFAREYISNNSKVSIIFESENSSFTLEIKDRLRDNLWTTDRPALFVTNVTSIESYYSLSNYYYDCDGFFYITHFKFFTVKPKQESNNVTSIIIAACVSTISIIMGIIFLYVCKKRRDALNQEEYVEPHLYETPKFIEPAVSHVEKQVLPPKQVANPQPLIYDYVYADSRPRNLIGGLKKPIPPAKPFKPTQLKQKSEEKVYDYPFATFTIK